MEGPNVTTVQIAARNAWTVRNENMVRSGKRNSTDQKVRGRFQVYVQTEGGAVNNGINERDSK